MLSGRGVGKSKQTAPKAGSARPEQAWMRDNGKDPRDKKSKANIERPRQAALLSGGKEPMAT